MLYKKNMFLWFMFKNEVSPQQGHQNPKLTNAKIGNTLKTTTDFTYC